MSTPMLRQYEALKSRHRDAFLLFRLGDFYELFGSDAREASRLLGLTLTQRQGVPMCGVPHHASRGYIGRLLAQGRKVAICEQISPPDGKGLAERDVVEVLSPGAVFDQDYLDPESNNYLVALGKEGDHLAVGWCDVSTGELTLAAYPARDQESLLQREIARLHPREILVQESLLERSRYLSSLAGRSGGGSSGGAGSQGCRDVVVNRIPDWGFSRESARERLCDVLGVENLRGFGFESSDPALLTGGALLDYLQENARHVLGHLHSLRRHHDEDVLILDDATLRNLEIVANMHDGSRSFTLLSVLDQTATPMGSRLLRRRLTLPARDQEEIERRLDQVEELYHRQQDLLRLRELLNQAYDLERLTSRLGVEKAHPRDVAAIAGTIEVAGKIAAILPDWFGQDAESGLLERPDHWQRALALGDQISSVLQDDPPVALNEGGIIREGYDTRLDRLRQLQRGSQEVLAAYLEELRRETGLQSLKIKYNRLLGHFFEIPRSQAERVPSFFIRRQSLANAERYTTTRLSELEGEINNATEESVAREQELFLALRARAAEEIPLLATLADHLARVDAAAALARAATLQGYRRPRLIGEPVIRITGGRHPVVEAHLPAGDFVPNDLALDQDKTRFALITGPNMAGKSTVLRQTALIALMAHAGSFVPAESAEIGLTDRIYCRVGASDNIARGESTFLVEMNETSNILRNATGASLVIMDEVGRGTSTHDGLAIAWAVCEYLLGQVRCRTLFATHYHELSGLEGAGFCRLTMAVDHSDQQIVFLKKLRPGSADRSYGVDVARMAGIPEAVIERARQLLLHFEGRSRDAGAQGEGQPAAPPAPPPRENGDGESRSGSQEELFAPPDLVTAELAGIDLDQCTPRDALDLLYRWQKLLQEDAFPRR
nr:DNA mismatch repair protein MutS [Alkalispirochaeta alkalica]